MRAQGAEFTKPPTDTTGSKISILSDGCGSLVQITHLMKWYERAT